MMALTDSLGEAAESSFADLLVLKLRGDSNDAQVIIVGSWSSLQNGALALPHMLRTVFLVFLSSWSVLWLQLVLNNLLAAIPNGTDSDRALFFSSGTVFCDLFQLELLSTMLLDLRPPKEDPSLIPVGFTVLFLGTISSAWYWVCLRDEVEAWWTMESSVSLQLPQMSFGGSVRRVEPPRPCMSSCPFSHVSSSIWWTFFTDLKVKSQL